MYKNRDMDIDLIKAREGHRCYGMGLGRLLAGVIEQNHDDKGIVWPASIAPYQVYICPLYREGSDVSEVAEELYADLTARGLEVLLMTGWSRPG